MIRAPEAEQPLIEEKLREAEDGLVTVEEVAEGGGSILFQAVRIIVRSRGHTLENGCKLSKNLRVMAQASLTQNQKHKRMQGQTRRRPQAAGSLLHCPPPLLSLWIPARCSKCCAQCKKTPQCCSRCGQQLVICPQSSFKRPCVLPCTF